jgi:hypothetical protein
MGLRRSFSKSEDNEAFSFVITGMEARILDAVVRRWGSEIVLCIHDGWVSRTPIPVHEIEAEILRETEYSVAIEGEQIPSNGTPECDGCKKYSDQLKANSDQWVTSVQSEVGKTKGLSLRDPAPGRLPGLPAVNSQPTSSVVQDFPGHPNACPLFDPHFRGSSLYVTSRPRWNVGPNFRGVTARGGRPRGSRNRATTALVRTVDSASAEGIL